VLRADSDAIAVLTLNRPQARNSLSEALIAAPADQLTAIAADRWAQNCREVGAGGEARRGEMIACNQRVDRMLDVNDGAQVIYMTSIMHKRNKPTRISMQKMIAIAYVGAMFGFAVVASAPAAGAAYTPEQQQACQNDAFRLCEHAIPDEPRVRACMIAKVRQLSPGCRRFFVRARRR
jgi:hypothetical protein